MPEGHSIHRIARIIDSLLVGQRVRASSPQGRFTSAAKRLEATTLTEVFAHGKHLFMGFNKDNASAAPQLWLHVHLGIYGYWRFTGDERFNAENLALLGECVPQLTESESQLIELKVHSALDPSERIAHEKFADRWYLTPSPFRVPEPVGTVRLRLEVPHGVADLCGPNTCELLEAPGVEQVLDRLGPDPLQPDADFSKFASRCAGRRRAIGEMLMDQGIIAGVGNIYRAEGLFSVRLDPFRPAQKVSRIKLRQIWDWLRKVMPSGVETGRVTLMNPDDLASYLDKHENPDEAVRRYYVYQREGCPCVCCGNAVRLATVSGRKLYWCPRCQC